MRLAYAWIEELFGSQLAREGGVVRRTRRNVTDEMLNTLVKEAKTRGFHVIETGDQVVVLCHQGELTIHC